MGVFRDEPDARELATEAQWFVGICSDGKRFSEVFFKLSNKNGEEFGIKSSVWISI